MRRELNLDPFVGSQAMDKTKHVVSCNQCERTYTLKTGLNVWRRHCKKKHGRTMYVQFLSVSVELPQS